jgi:hypothetical protein
MPADAIALMQAQLDRLRAGKAEARPMGAQVDAARARCTLARRAFEQAEAVWLEQEQRCRNLHEEAEAADAALASLLAGMSSNFKMPEGPIDLAVPPETPMAAVEQTWVPAASAGGPGGIPEQLSQAFARARESLSRSRSPSVPAGQPTVAAVTPTSPHQAAPTSAITPVDESDLEMLDGAASMSLGASQKLACLASLAQASVLGGQATAQRRLAGAILSNLFQQDPAAAEALIKEARQVAAPLAWVATAQQAALFLEPTQVYNPSSAKRGQDCSRTPPCSPRRLET